MRRLSESEKTELWDRFEEGESLRSIGRRSLDFKEALTDLLAVEPGEGEPEEIDGSAPESDEES